MKKNWKKPTITIFNDSSVHSGGNWGVAHEVLKYCDGGAVKTLSMTFKVITTPGGEKGRAASENNPNGAGRWGIVMTGSTPGVAGCS